MRWLIDLRYKQSVNSITDSTFNLPVRCGAHFACSKFKVLVLKDNLSMVHTFQHRVRDQKAGIKGMKQCLG